jgi:hypothetical protein
VLKNKWVSTLSYQSVAIDPKGLPGDYKQGYTFLFPFVLSDEFPAADMNIFSLTAGKFFPAGRKLWFTTEVGLSLVNGDVMSFTPQPVVTDGFFYTSSNYSAKKEKKTSVGAMIRADMDWAILPFAGLGAGAFANFNSIQSPIGFEIKLMVGWMNNKKQRQ